jgi:MinD-like ATPase involved in chromosome partitioning or flagellar assembly
MVDGLTFAFAASLDGRLLRWSRHIVDHGPGELVDTVAERRSLYRRDYRIFVVAADSRLIDAELVEELRDRGRSVIVVWNPADSRTKELAARLGADALIDADASSEEFVRCALALAGEWVEDEDEPVGEAEVPLVPGPTVVVPERAAPRRRSGAFRLVVCGPGEEPALVGAEIARTVGERGQRAVLVDANEWNPSVVQQLGLPVLPNLRIAVDAVRDRHHRLTDALLPVPEGRFWVLGGLADAGQWAEVTPTEVVAVVDELAEGCEVVVIQAAPAAEDLAGYGGPERFGITRRMLAGADRIIGVAPATPAGVAQLSAWMADVRVVAHDVAVDLVLTRAPEDRFRRGELVERLQADLAPASVTLLPHDPRVERAVWDGSLVRRGPFRKAVNALAATVVPAEPKRKAKKAKGASRG